MDYDIQQGCCSRCWSMPPALLRRDPRAVEFLGICVLDIYIQMHQQLHLSIQALLLKYNLVLLVCIYCCVQ